MIKAIYFDLDNTLVNRDASIDRFVSCFVQRFSSDLRRINALQVGDIIKKQDNGGYLSDNSPYSHIFEAGGAELSVQLPWKNKRSAQELSQYWQHNFPRCAVEMNGAANLLNYLSYRKYHLGVISNGADLSRRVTINATSFSHLFSQVVSSDGFGVSKPDPLIFTDTTRQAGFETNECVYVGDHPVKDALGAINAGMTAVWLAGFHENIDLPQNVLTVNSLAEVLDVLGL